MCSRWKTSNSSKRTMAATTDFSTPKMGTIYSSMTSSTSLTTTTWWWLTSRPSLPPPPTLPPPRPSPPPSLPLPPTLGPVSLQLMPPSLMTFLYRYIILPSFPLYYASSILPQFNFSLPQFPFKFFIFVQLLLFTVFSVSKRVHCFFFFVGQLR